jgi:hypothetical protein
LKILHLSWDDVQRLSRRLAEKVRGSGFRPEIIVALGRGGFVPARILCDRLDVKELASVGVEYYSDIEKREREPKILYPLNADVKDRSVLLVDDVADTGRSLQFAVSHIIERGAKEIRVATLHHKPWSTFQPDFYVEETEAWVIYPWERLEAARSFINKLRGEGLSSSEIKQRLFALSFKEEDVDALLEDI